MKIILEKFYSVKKYGVAVFLAAVSCFSSFGEISCVPSEPFKGSDGNWYVTVHCFGDVDDTTQVIVPEPSSGGCSGCTAMSPEQCQQVKTQVSNYADSIVDSSLPVVGDEWDTVFEQVEELKSRLEGVKDNIDNYKIDLEYNAEEYIDNLDFYNGIMRAYGLLEGYEFLPPETDDLDEKVEFVDEALSSMQEKYEESINSIKYEVLSIKEYVDSMDCSPCSGGSGGGDSGGGNSGGCPCKEVLEAIQQILTEHKDNVKKIKERLDGWDKYLKQITTSVNALAFMGTNFTYAVKYRTLDGVAFSMKQLDDKLLSKKSLTFDYQEFGNLSWYSRIEYLLMSIAGVFSKTNREDTLTSSKIDSTYNSVADREGTLNNSVNSIETKFGSLNSAVTGLMSAFSGAVGSGSSSGQVTLCASWFGGRGLVMTIPDNVISTSRVVFSLLWTVIFTFTMYQIILNGWVFIVKFIQFWITQTTGFLK